MVLVLTPSPQGHSSATLSLLIVGSSELRHFSGLQWHNVCTKFQGQVIGSEDDWVDTDSMIR
jgi:hypothetical protein